MQLIENNEILVDYDTAILYNNFESGWNSLTKNYEYYSQFGWTEEPKIEYDWAGYSK